MRTTDRPPPAAAPPEAEVPPAREEARIQRLVDAARDLANETGSAAFTVAHVAERAGSSLKGFYGVFAGKDDLLLALLAEESRTGAVVLAEIVGRETEPPERIRAYVRGIFELASLPRATGYARVLVHEHRRLAETRPEELDAALAPLVDLLAREIAAATGAADAHRDASTVFGLALAGIHDASMDRAEPAEVAEYLWRFCWHGLEDRAAREASGMPDVTTRGGPAR